MGKGCIFKSCSELDERQLLLRGNVFQHVVVLLFGLIFLNAMLKDCGVTWAEGKGENWIIFWAGAVCWGAYPAEDRYTGSITPGTHAGGGGACRISSPGTFCGFLARV